MNVRSLMICCITVLFVVPACKKNNISAEELYIYAPPGNVSYNVSLANYVTLRSSFMPGVNSGVPVFITRAYDKDVKVMARIDTSLIRSYDSVHKTTSPSIPVGAISLKNEGLVTIKAGQTSSFDSLFIDITNISLIDRSKTYIIPLVFATQDGSIPVSTTRNIQFLRASFTNVLASVVTPGNSSTVNATITQTPNSSTGPDKIYFVGTMNMAIPAENMELSLSENNALVATYNTANGTNYLPFPANSFSLMKNSVTIPAGATISRDSFTISLSDFSLFEAGTYILPLTAKDEGIVNLDPNRKTVYVILRVVYEPFDRTLWRVVNFSSEEAVGEGPNNGRVIHILDGNISTFWHSQWQGASPGLPHWFVIDLGENRVLNGLRFLNRQGTTQGRPRNVTVEVSSDNTTWNLAGNLSLANQNTSEQRLSFSQPTSTTRYFKVTITSTWSATYANLAELNAF